MDSFKLNWEDPISWGPISYLMPLFQATTIICHILHSPFQHKLKHPNFVTYSHIYNLSYYIILPYSFMFISSKMKHYHQILLPLLLLLLSLSPNNIANGHNITRILAQHPEFSTFNHYLTVTHLAGEINRRQTITVLAVDNAGMSSILSKHLSIYTLKNVLSLHVLVDYFGTRKLHQITDGTTLVSSMFQATGAASGTSGYVNITDFKGIHILFFIFYWFFEEIKGNHMDYCVIFVSLLSTRARNC